MCASATRSVRAPRTLVGPELNGIVGRKAASVADYAMYSAGMKKLGADGWVWTEENIDKWIANPKAMIPDSPMALAFPGVPDAAAAGRHHRLFEDPANSPELTA